MGDSAPQAPVSPPGSASPRAALAIPIAALAALYFLAAKAGLTLAFQHPSATPIWPPTGIALAALLRFGFRVWPGVLVGAFFANLTTAGSWLTSLGVGAGNTLEALAGAWLVRPLLAADPFFDRPRTVFRFAERALASTTLSATVGVASLGLGGFIPPDALGSVWLTWWLGDVGGDLIVAPLLLLWTAPARSRWTPGRILEAVALCAALGLVGLGVFGGVLPSPIKDDPMEFLTLPLLAWAAFRFSQREAATATAFLMGIAVSGTLRGSGPFGTLSPNESLLLLDAFVGVMGITTLAVAASVSAHRRAEEELSRTAGIVESSEDAIVGKTLEGTIVSWNPGAERLYGYTAEEARGRPISLLMPEDRPDEMPEILGKVRRGERVQDYETVRVRKDGRRVVVSLRISPIRDPSGTIVGASAIAREITERKWAEQRLATQFAVTRILAESSALREAANPLLGALCQGLGWDGGEIWRLDDESGLLRSEAAAHTSFAPGADLAERVFHSGQPVFAADLERPPSFVRAPDATGRFRAVFAWPLRLGGRITGVLALYGREPRAPKPEMVDVIGDIVSRLGQFIERETTLGGLHRLEKAVETVAIGVTITDVNGRILYTNPAEASMHGYASEELIGKHVRIFMPQEWRPASGRPPEVRSWKRETVNVRRDGTIFPVQLLSDAVTGPDGRPVAFVTCCEEITERKRAEEHLRSSEERYRLLFERNLAGVYRATFKGRLLECNEAFARILGYASREEILTRSVFDLFFDRADREESLARLEEKGTLTNFELRMRRKDGSALWVLENETLLRGEGGERLVEGTLIDITERKLAEKRIEFHAYHDPLTGLPNRMFLEDRLDVALAQARRSGRGLAVMFLDLDNFKDVNDRLGHAVGDWLLQEVARRLRETVREDDTVARLGGDEFVLLLPQVRQVEGAARVAAKVMARMEGPFRKDDHDLLVTASIGIALFPQDGDNGETLLQNADRAMYRAKRRGRNAYELFREP